MSFKKAMAGVTAVTIIAMNMANFTVNAAGLTVASTAYDDGTDTITVTVSGKDFSADNLVSWTVRTSGGTQVSAGTSTEVTEANGSFVITDATNFNNLSADTYSVAFSTVAWDIGGAIVNVGNDNQVVVTATVAPTLSFSLSSNTISLGTLNTDGSTYTEGNITSTVATNAQGGAVVTFDATGLADRSAAVLKSIGSLQAATTTLTAEANDAYKFAIDAAVTGGSTNIGQTGNAVTSVSGPSAPVNAVVHIGAVAGATTEAGNYTDTLTFNVTGTF